MTPLYSIVVPTRRHSSDIAPLLSCIAQQTKAPAELIVVYDKKCSYDEYKSYENELQTKLADISLRIVSHHADKDFVPNKGVSYVRNVGIMKVKTPLMCCVDDDNIFGDDFFEKFLQTYEAFAAEHSVGAEAIFIPTEYYHQTKRIRSQGYRAFNYRLTRPTKFFVPSATKSDYLPIELASSNCLLGTTDLFQKVPFDERMLFVYEDLMMTRCVSGQYRALYLAPQLSIHHMMRTKTKLQDLYIGNPRDAYQKARNRIFLVKACATKTEKWIFFGFGLWGHTTYLFLQTLRYFPPDILAIRKALCRGTRDGLLGRKP